MQTFREPSSTDSQSHATSWSELVHVKLRLGWRWVPSARRSYEQFGIEILSHVIGVGPARFEQRATWEQIVALHERDEVLLGCVDQETEQRMKEAVDHAYRTGDTIGGIFEVVAHGLPPGLGSHIVGTQGSMEDCRRPLFPYKQ